MNGNKENDLQYPIIENGTFKRSVSGDTALTVTLSPALPITGGITVGLIGDENDN